MGSTIGQQVKAGPTTVQVTARSGWRRLLTSNNTDTADITSLTADTETAPSITLGTTAVVALGPYNQLCVLPFGADAANEDFHLGIELVEPIWDVKSGGTALWTSRLVGIFACTLGTHTGISGGIVTDSEFYADTISQVSNTDEAIGATTDIKSTGQNRKAFVVCDCAGAEYARFRFDGDAGSVASASANALYKYL